MTITLNSFYHILFNASSYTQLFRTKVQEMLVDTLISLLYTNNTYSCNTREFLFAIFVDRAREIVEILSSLNFIERTF